MKKIVRRLFNGGTISAVIVFCGILAFNLHGQATPLNSKVVFLKNGDSSLVFLNEIQGLDILRFSKVLASDSMEGRATGSRGYQKAASFVDRHFKELEIKTQFQNFTVARKELRTRVFLDSNNGDSVNAFNVVGYLEGTKFKNDYIAVTAHLDHLGKNRDSIFHGANDNASGVGVMMKLAEEFSTHRPEYSLIFIAFAGEEAGLLGSQYFVTHPPIDLKKIRLLVNLDLVGSGSEGLMIQGIERCPKELERVTALNKQYFHFELSTRPNSPNSDQYFFNAIGVPAVFIYAYKGTIPYHDPRDTWEKLDTTIMENVAKFVAVWVWNF